MYILESTQCPPEDYHKKRQCSDSTAGGRVLIHTCFKGICVFPQFVRASQHIVSSLDYVEGGKGISLTCMTCHTRVHKSGPGIFSAPLQFVLQDDIRQEEQLGLAWAQMSYGTRRTAAGTRRGGSACWTWFQLGKRALVAIRTGDAYVVCEVLAVRAGRRVD